MRGRIQIGVPVPTENTPPVFFTWFKRIREEYPYATMEVSNGEIQIVRVRTPIDSIDGVKGLKYGKIVSDATGEFLEKTYVPRYSRERDEIILEQ